MRETAIRIRRAYEFFAGQDGDGTPIWTKDLKAHRPLGLR